MNSTARIYLPKTLAFLFYAIVLLGGSCNREPEWSREIRNFLESTNRDLEEIAPHFARDSSPDNVIVGLSRIDKVMDRILADLSTFFKKYPLLLKDPKPIGMYHGAQVQRLQKNVQSIFRDGAYWYEKLKDQKDYKNLAQSILRKIREADKLTRQPQ